MIREEQMAREWTAQNKGDEVFERIQIWVFMIQILIWFRTVKKNPKLNGLKLKFDGMVSMPNLIN